MDINMKIYNIFTGGVADQASQEAINSQMPGRENGPADAYRHILLSAELKQLKQLKGRAPAQTGK